MDHFVYDWQEELSIVRSPVTRMSKRLVVFTFSTKTATFSLERLRFSHKTKDVFNLENPCVLKNSNIALNKLTITKRVQTAN